MQFQNPPLVELVVELKWAGAGTVAAPAGIPQGMPYPEPPNIAHEKFLSDFRQLAAKSNWKQSERLMPQGFNLHFQPALRIRSDDPSRSSILLQVGQGIFSAHALRPYKEWETFWPIAQEGIEMLLKSRADTEKLQPFFAANVMYIDVFEEAIVGEMSEPRFLQDVLGFGLALPPVVKRQIINEDQVEIQFSFKLPLEDQLEMRLSVNGNAVWGDKKGIVMSTIVSSQRNVLPDLHDISAVFGASHMAIRRTFIGLTERVHSKMNPIGEGQ
jgi:uncharacterized protein (TIGR04255 family)